MSPNHKATETNNAAKAGNPNESILPTYAESVKASSKQARAGVVSEAVDNTDSSHATRSLKTTAMPATMKATEWLAATEGSVTAEKVDGVDAGQAGEVNEAAQKRGAREIELAKERGEIGGGQDKKYDITFTLGFVDEEKRMRAEAMERKDEGGAGKGGVKD